MNTSNCFVFLLLQIFIRLPSFLFFFSYAAFDTRFGNMTFIESQSLAYEKYLNYFQFLLLLLYIAAFLFCFFFFSSDFIWVKNHLLFIFITLPSHLTGHSYLIPIVSYEHSFLSYKYLLPLIASFLFLSSTL